MSGVYPLRSSAILDSGATLHVFNNYARFQNLKPAPDNDFLWAGEGKLKIQGYGEVDIQLQTVVGRPNLIRLRNVAFVPELADRKSVV